MDYVNPVSIAHMYDTAKDTSLPGTGYGLTQGFLEGQAQQQAKNFLNMSMAQGAQDFARKQLDNQMAWQGAPDKLEAQRVSNRQGNAAAGFNEAQTAQIQQHIKDAQEKKLMDSTSLFGSQSDIIKTIQSPMQRKAYVDMLKQRYKMMGLPDPGIVYDGTEESWANISRAADIARLMSEQYNNLSAQHADVETQQRGATQRSGEANDTSRDVARINGEYALARAEKASKERGLTTAEYMRQLDTEVLPILSKHYANQPLTPEEKAKVETWNALHAAYSGNAQRFNPEQQGEIQKEKTKKGMEGLKEGVDSILRGNKAPGEIKQEPLPESEQDLQERLKRY